MRSFIPIAALLGTALAAPFTNSPRDGFTKASPGGPKALKVTEHNTLNGTYHDGKTKVFLADRSTDSNDFSNAFTSKGFSKAAPSEEVEVTARNTLNGTHYNGKGGLKARAEPLKAELPFKFVNNFKGGKINAYISGLDSNGAVVFLAADGGLIYPSSGGSPNPKKVEENIAIPLTNAGETLNFTLPIELSSGRVYFVEGELSFYMVDTGNGDGLVQPSATNPADPSAGLNWGFIELTYTKSSIWANISYVDFVGLVMGMRLHVASGETQTTAGLVMDAVTKVCDDLAKQGEKDGFPWGSLCIANAEGKPVRAISPGNYNDLNPEGFAKYWSGYVDEVWKHYSTNPLTINTQMAAGEIECKVEGDMFNCAGDNRGYAKPSANDIWGCNTGPFAIKEGDNPVHVAVVPRLCAAFTRSTLLLDGGNIQPAVNSSNYYTIDPTSHYSRLVHIYEVDERGYAFPYDDVNPNGHKDASGTVSSGTAESLTVWIGGPPDEIAKIGKANKEEAQQREGDTQQKEGDTRKEGDTQQKEGDTRQKEGDTRQKEGDTRQKEGDTQQKGENQGEEKTDQQDGEMPKPADGDTPMQ